MVKLSVILVNYNVKYFLEQALLAVARAMEGVSGEVIVVDNASSDGSVEFIRQRFPQVKLMANTENVGFSRANNQAIRQATGEYVLLLNPDTVVGEDTFHNALTFMDSHPDAGALGVKMVDGRGRFLPESKRAFPSPRVAFFKAVGLSALLPRSRTFARYHLGHLPDDETATVDVLAGAFMLLRKEALDKTGLLDETFFMYGEDIDLSYRIIQSGYRNYYFPHSPIIHYKGESTKKGSLNYVRMFYEAMAIFVRKHFGSGRARTFSMLIQAAIWLKAMLHVAGNTFRQLWLLLLDGLVLFGGLFVIKDFWAAQVRETPDYYPWEFTWLVLPAYVVLWLTAVFFSGGYDRPLRLSKAFRGLFVGTIAILALYGVIDESLRFSRAIILLGAAWAAIAMGATRYLLHFARHRSFGAEEQPGRNLLIVGGPAEADRVQGLLKEVGVFSRVAGLVLPAGMADTGNEQVLGTTEQLPDLVRLFEVDEVIFCAKDLAYRDIIRYIEMLGPEREFKFVAEGSRSIIGSNSRHTAGDLYAIDANLQIATPMQRRNKCVLDLLFCVALLLTLPVHLMLVKRPGGLLKNWWRVLTGRQSWVGYCYAEVPQPLPALRPGVLCPLDAHHTDMEPSPTLIAKLNLAYARDYTAWRDVHVVRKGYRELGRI